MRIAFVHEGLFPGTTRSARHVEAMARRFAAKGHLVSAITTVFPGSAGTDDVQILRLPHAPEGPADKDGHLLERTIARHLKSSAADIVFAESLTPLSAVAVKAAREGRVPTIVRVLADRDGIVHEFGARRSNPRLVRKKIAALLDHATVAAASSDRCARLLREQFDGPIEIIEKSVDLNFFRIGRTTRRDMDAFLNKYGLDGRTILLYARERLRQSTPAAVLPLLKSLRESVPDVAFVLVGELEGVGLDEAAQALGIAACVKALGPLELREFFAAYEAATVFLVPPGSRASAREILEAMAMGAAVACFEETAEAASQVIAPGVTGIVLRADDLDVAGQELGEFLKDGEGVRRQRDNAIEVARRHDLVVAIESVERLCERVLGRSVAPETHRPASHQRTGASGGANGASAATEAVVSNGITDLKEEGKAAMEEHDDDLSASGGGRGGEEAPVPRSEGTSSHDSGNEEVPPERSGAPSPEDKPTDLVVWSEEDVEGEAVRFDPDSEEGFEPLEVEEAEGPPKGRGDDPRRERERGRDNDRDRGRRRRGGRSGPDVQELGASSGIDIVDIPSDRRQRRTGALEPGLTLKDLLPFLRPPKTVLVLGASTGNGHNRTAAALAEAFKGVDRNLVIREADLLDLTEKTYRSTFVRTLLEDLSRSPAVFGTPFETVDPAADAQMPAELDDLLKQAFGDRLNQLVVDRRPDHLVCTHWLPFKHLEKLKEEQRLLAQVTAVIPEPDLFVRWISPVVSHYMVVDELVRGRLVKHGVDPLAISVIGSPVSPTYTLPFDREGAARSLGLRPQVPTILFRPGGIGATERILAVAKSLMDSVGPINLLVVAGKNERLKDEVGALEGARGSVVRSFGFVDNIRDLMGVSDLLISRASPHTVAEANAAGLPMILLRPSPGVEERTADRALALGVAMKAYDEDSLDLAVREILKNRRVLTAMQDAAQREKRPHAAQEAVDRLGRLVK